MSRLVQPARFGAWRLDGHPQVIEYATHVVRQIHGEAMRSFRMFGHGGLAIGGLLFGQGDRHLVRILAWRPFACDYSLGPTFTLSESDQSRFAEFLSACREDSELAELTPVGWYRSQTRGTTQLTASDLEIHQRHFHEEWQLVIILEPRRDAPTSASVFIQPHLQPGTPTPALCVEDVLPELGHGESNDDLEPSPVSSDEEPTDVEVAEASESSAETSGIDASPTTSVDEIPEEFPPAPKGRSPWVIGPVIGLLALAGAGLAFRRWVVPPEYWQAVGQYLGSVRSYWSGLLVGESIPALSLRTAMSGSGLLIRWDTSPQILRGVEGGSLRITDGASIQDRELDAGEISQGAVTYAPLTRDVSVRLTILRVNEPPIVEATRYLGANAAARKPAVVPQRPEELEAEIQSLRSAILRQAEQNSTLEATLRTLSEVGSAQAAEPPPPPAPKPPPPKRPTLQQKAPDALASTSTARQAEPSNAPPPAPAAEAAASEGMLIWTGFLPDGQTLTINSGQASIGNISGDLPGPAVRINAWPAELASSGLVVYTAESRYSGEGQAERPAPRNSWTQTTYRYDPARAGAVTVMESPSEENGWRRVVVGATGRPLRVVVIQWSVAEQ